MATIYSVTDAYIERKICAGQYKPLTKNDENNILITVTEGKYHEVKRILKAVNNCVLSLKRVSENGIILDESLKEGEYRKLTQNELEILSAKEKKQ